MRIGLPAACQERLHRLRQGGQGCTGSRRSHQQALSERQSIRLVKGWTVGGPSCLSATYAPDILQDLLERNWRKYLPGRILLPGLPWRRQSAMPLMNIVPFVTSSKRRYGFLQNHIEVSRGKYHHVEDVYLSGDEGARQQLSLIAIDGS